ncbi:hypothetical protein [Geminocystis sp.]
MNLINEVMINFLFLIFLAIVHKLIKAIAHSPLTMAKKHGMV